MKTWWLHGKSWKSKRQLLNEINAKLDRLLAQQAVQTGVEARMAKTLDDVLADVAAETTVTQSAITLLQGLKAQLDAAIAAGDLTKVQAIADGIEANTASLSAAVIANTPAAPPAPPAPPTPPTP